MRTPALTSRKFGPGQPLRLHHLLDKRPRPALPPMLRDGAVAQLGERVVRNDEVSGSIPLGSTIFFWIPQRLRVAMFREKLRAVALSGHVAARTQIQPD